MHDRGPKPKGRKAKGDGSDAGARVSAESRSHRSGMNFLLSVKCVSSVDIEAIAKSVCYQTQILIQRFQITYFLLLAIFGIWYPFKIMS